MISLHGLAGSTPIRSVVNRTYDAVSRRRVHQLSRTDPVATQRRQLMRLVEAARSTRFGRDHGYYGRILSQTVVVSPTLTVRKNREIYGFCFTPQDGNSLVSSIAAALWLIDPDPTSVAERLAPIRKFVFREI